MYDPLFHSQIIVNASELVLLDGKEVPPAMRAFLERWKVNKEVT